MAKFADGEMVDRNASDCSPHANGVDTEAEARIIDPSSMTQLESRRALVGERRGAQACRGDDHAGGFQLANRGCALPFPFPETFGLRATAALALTASVQYLWVHGADWPQTAGKKGTIASVARGSMLKKRNAIYGRTAFRLWFASNCVEITIIPWHVSSSLRK
jgi:hypothetical protein